MYSNGGRPENLGRRWALQPPLPDDVHGRSREEPNSPGTSEGSDGTPGLLLIQPSWLSASGCLRSAHLVF